MSHVNETICPKKCKIKVQNLTKSSSSTSSTFYKPWPTRSKPILFQVPKFSVPQRNLEKRIIGEMSCLREACWDRVAPADSSAQVIPWIRRWTRGIRGKLLGKNTSVWLFSRPRAGHRPPGSYEKRNRLRPLLPRPPPGKMKVFYLGRFFHIFEYGRV